jgi:hypothetical protein
LWPLNGSFEPRSFWEDYVGLTFTEIQYYGKDDLPTRWSIWAALDYLLEKVPEAYKPPLEEQKALLSGNAD